MQMLFQMEVQGDFSEAAKDSFVARYVDDMSQEAYFTSCYEAVRDNLSAIDAKIEAASENWKLSRISRIDMSILRIAVAEIVFLSDVPEAVSADEAVRMAKIYSSDDSHKFINGILGRIIRSTGE
jgi:N utilization substance protein B